MEITASKRLQSIGAYAFAEVDKEVEKLYSEVDIVTCVFTS